MAMLLLLIGIVAAIAVFVWAMSSSSPGVKIAGSVGALLVLFLFVLFSSVRHVSEDEVGVVIKHYGPELPGGTIIATDGQKGPQARVLGPGWHFWLWPGLYDIEVVPIVQVGSDQVGLITALDGQPLPTGQAFAAEWDEPGKMLLAEHFLGAGAGNRGPQASVLKPAIIDSTRDSLTSNSPTPQIFRRQPLASSSPTSATPLTPQRTAAPPSSIVVNGGSGEIRCCRTKSI